MSDALSNKPVGQSLLFTLLLITSLSVVPHFWHLNIWVSTLFFLAIGMRLLFWRIPQKTAPRWLLIPLVILGLIVVVTQSGYTEGRQFGVALLVVMLGLKILELRSRRDLYVTVLLGYFVLVTQFLYTTDMAITAYVLVLAIGYTSILYRSNRVENSLSIREPLVSSAILVLGAIPVMVVLFFLFPRLDGPLWSLNLGKGGGITGMSDTISMGSVSQLSLSFETAFRVKFDGEPPPPKDRYWRGIVLWQVGEKDWQRGWDNDDQIVDGPAIADESTYDYEIFMEPSRQRWLFPLDRLAEQPDDLLFNSSAELRTRKNIEARYTFRARSTVHYLDRQLSRFDRLRGLQLPPNTTERMSKLVSTWRKDSANDRMIVQAALRHFYQQPFVYTLQPPALTENPVDQFLFETRKGFCEHYATSFVVLMRLAGIPARVIGGYQGGELNPHGGHLIVRQSDAHAWAEVWLEDEGWVRVDPTAAVAPERIEQSIDITQLEEGAAVMFNLGEMGVFSGIWKDMGWLADNLELQWHQWIVGYNRSRQTTVLEKMGLGFLDDFQLSLAAMVSGLLIAGLIFLLLVRSGRTPVDPLQAAYISFKRKLNRAGLQIPPWMGPIDLAEKSIAKFPDKASEIRAIVNQYVALRYGPGDSPAVRKSMKKRIRSFRAKGRKDSQ